MAERRLGPAGAKRLSVALAGVTDSDRLAETGELDRGLRHECRLPGPREPRGLVGPGREHPCTPPILPLRPMERLKPLAESYERASGPEFFLFDAGVSLAIRPTASTATKRSVLFIPHRCLPGVQSGELPPETRTGGSFPFWFRCILPSPQLL